MPLPKDIPKGIPRARPETTVEEGRAAPAGVPPRDGFILAVQPRQTLMGPGKEDVYLMPSRVRRQGVSARAGDPRLENTRRVDAQHRDPPRFPDGNEEMLGRGV